MGFVSESFWIDFLLALLLLAFLIYWFMTSNDSYWDQRGVANIKQSATLIINPILGIKSQGETVREWYERFPNEKYFGFVQFRRPIFMVRDPDLIYQILVKDFNHFVDRGQPQSKIDPMTKNLFHSRGQLWREMRYKLTPTFTSGKLKGMFEQVSKCGANMIRKIEELTKENSEFESKEFLFEFTSDVIASCAFGLQFEPNTLEFNAFKKSVQQVFKPTIWTIVRFLTALSLPKLAELLGIRPFMAKENADYFMSLIREATNYRKENNIERKDYLQLLLTLKDQEDRGLLTHIPLSSSDTCEDDAVILDQIKFTGDDQDQPPRPHTKYTCEDDAVILDQIKFTGDDQDQPPRPHTKYETVCANSVIFLIAGSESTSLTISFTLCQLALHPSVQQRLHNEVDLVLASHSGQWSYQAVKDMTYLDQVVQETQRLYPIIPLLQRECTKTYKVPGSDLVIEKGSTVGIPVMGLHMDPQFYPDPEAFKPERFQGNNFKPNPAFLPFGDGPRICIAVRFAVMEVKTALARIMADYSIKLSPKTQVPLQPNPRSFFPSVKGGVWLQFEKRQKA